MKVFENFANYAKHVTTSNRLALEDQTAALFKAGARLSGFGTTAISPWLTAGQELSGGYLSSQLTNPNSPLFRLFAEGNPTRLMKILSVLPGPEAAARVGAEISQERRQRAE